MTKPASPTTLLLLASSFLFLPSSTLAYSAGVSNLNRRALAGVWRLIGARPHAVGQPMKEFTVYPKPPPPEYLLRLKPDGSFEQCPTDLEAARESVLQKESAQTKEMLQQKRKKKKREQQQQQQQMIMKGTWDYLDGKLILATDRPQDSSAATTSGDGVSHKQRPSTNRPDTILVGRVVASSQKTMTSGKLSLEDDDSNSNDAASSTQNKRAPVDTHLSVPKGRVKIGKYMYQRTHPSFFEQPMFQPQTAGSFELQQVLGELNTQEYIDEENQPLVERFRRRDFADKKFLLTNYPLPERQPKGNLRWSIKYNQYVEDPPKKQFRGRGRHAHDNDDDDPSSPSSASIRVMGLVLFGNGTFETTAGLGSGTVLRGKWDIFGEERDTLWMQVWRFGFGRSVSGSTFSEGRMLTQDDAKTYWGKIGYKEEEGGKKKKKESSSSSSGDETGSVTNSDDDTKRLEIKGSVIIGGGLEPQPVALFIMREEEGDNEFDDDDDDDEDEDDDDEEDLRSTFQFPSLLSDDDGDDGIDWDNAFQ